MLRNTGGRRLPIIFGCLLFAVVPTLAVAQQVSHHGLTIRLKHHRRDFHCHIIMRGSRNDDFLDGSGSACDEEIFGYGGNDVLIGGPGDNRLVGGKGADVLTGGSGPDTFAYERASDSTVDAPDIITDFTEHGPKSDTIDLGGLARTSGVKLSFIGWEPFTGSPGEVNYHLIQYWQCSPMRVCHDGYYTIVEADLTGSGSADFAIDLDGRHFLKAGNFVLQ